MKSLLLLWKEVADESAAWCCTSANRDYETVTARHEHEGDSFLTITLPDFGKAFERALDLGFVDRNTFPGFAAQLGAGLPRFLGGFLDLVFCRSTGQLHDVPNAEAIRCIRQLTLMFGKIALACSDERVLAAFEQYVVGEQDVRRADRTRSPIDLEAFRRISSLLFRTTFLRVDRKVYNGEVIPKHGPGSTADGLVGNQKFDQRVWTRRLERLFSCSDFLLPNHSHYEWLDGVDILEPEAEIPAKVISVPKTLKTPRIIAMEPTCMMFVQQALKSVIVEELRRNDCLWTLLGFEDQTPNQRLAREGSLTGALATLDLSEASDRVSNQHVQELFREFRTLSEAVQACRSRTAEVQGHGVIPLAKFASMGSALTFPVEAMVFLTAVMMGIEQELRRPLTWRDVVSLQGKVRVYGDDIIVPVEYVQSVVLILERLGFLVNKRKSFWNGKFRESCGKEYYAGEDISIVRVRRLFPTRRTDVPEVESIVSLRNQFYQAGYWRTARWLDNRIVRLLRYFPTVAPTSSVLGRWSYLGYETESHHPTLHTPLVKGWEKVAEPPINRLDGIGALHKFFLLRGDEPMEQEDHLERSGRPQTATLRLRKRRPF